MNSFTNRNLKCIISIITLVSLFDAITAEASGRLERIKKTGTLMVGTRTSAPPFAQLGSDGKFSGFSVDLSHYIANKLSEKLGSRLIIEFSEVIPKTRIPAVKSGTLDMVCGLTTVTRDRDLEIDYSLPIFLDGTRILVAKELVGKGLKSLNGKKIAFNAGSVTGDIVLSKVPKAELVPFADLDSSISSFLANEVDAVANIGSFLAAKQKELSLEFTTALLPTKRSLNSEIMACILPENDSDFRDAINMILSTSFEGISELRGDYADLYFKWFGKNGSLQFPLTDMHQDLLVNSQIWLK